VVVFVDTFLAGGGGGFGGPVEAGVGEPPNLGLDINEAAAAATRPGPLCALSSAWWYIVFGHCSVGLQGSVLTDSGLGSRFVFQLGRVEFNPLLMVSTAEFLVAGFLNASWAALAIDLTPCDLAILLSKSGRDAKYLETMGSRHEHC